MAQPQMQEEKRNTRRFSFNLPVMVKRLGGGPRDLQGYTRDVSSRGAFVYLCSEAEQGTTIEFVMTLPAEVTMADPIRVSCRGRVLRVERLERKQGVAVAIDHYDFLGED